MSSETREILDGGGSGRATRNSVQSTRPSERSKRERDPIHDGESSRGRGASSASLASLASQTTIAKESCRGGHARTDSYNLGQQPRAHSGSPVSILPCPAVRLAENIEISDWDEKSAGALGRTNSPRRSAGDGPSARSTRLRKMRRRILILEQRRRRAGVVSNDGRDAPISRVPDMESPPAPSVLIASGAPPVDEAASPRSSKATWLPFTPTSAAYKLGMTHSVPSSFPLRFPLEPLASISRCCVRMKEPRDGGHDLGANANSRN